MKLAGIVLIVLGVLALAYHGIRYSDQDKLIDIGLAQGGYKSLRHGFVHDIDSAPK